MEILTGLNRVRGGVRVQSDMLYTHRAGGEGGGGGGDCNIHKLHILPPNFYQIQNTLPTKLNI